jgi:uncharacterized membrane protein YphA (DoxX/SURF4 family)
MHNYAKISIFGILALVALRVAIGWHFYMEGVSKVHSDDFSSQGLLASARGPLADKYQQLIWDHDGRLRLDKAKVTELFTSVAEKAKTHFAMTDQQKKNTERLQKQTLAKLEEVYAGADEEIFKYRQSVERVENMRQSPMWTQVTSLRGQKERIEAERLRDVRPALSSIDAIWKQYERQLNGMVEPAQLQAAGYLYFNRPGEGLMSVSVVDRIVPIFDMSIGILLMLGLLTPLASWAGALFLLGVVLSQMPGYPGTQPTYYQAIEALALVVLATTDAGRYAGLDFIPWAWWQKRKANAKLAAA